MTRWTNVLLPLILCSLMASSGCLERPPASGPDSTAAAETAAQASSPALTKIKVKDGAGTTLASMKLKDYGFKVVDGNGADLGKLKRDGERIKVKVGGETMFKLKPKDPKGVKLSDGTGEKTLVRLKWKNDGWSVRDGSDNTFALLKKQGTSWTAVDPAGQLLGLVKVKEGKCKVYDKNDQTLLSVADTSTPAGTALMALSNVPILQRCALYAFFRDRKW